MKLTESTSRILAGLEGALLCLPLTALFLYGVPLINYYNVTNSPGADDVVYAVASMVIFIALVCAWRLLLSFIFGGREKLQAASNRWWILPYATAGLGFIGKIYVVTTATPSTIGMFGWGVPMIVPLIHLHLERKTERQEFPQ